MDNRRDEPNLKLINMEQVEVEKIDWLLYPFIPFGKVTILQGDHNGTADYCKADKRRGSITIGQ